MGLATPDGDEAEEKPPFVELGAIAGDASARSSRIVAPCASSALRTAADVSINSASCCCCCCACWGEGEPFFDWRCEVEADEADGKPPWSASSLGTWSKEEFGVGNSESLASSAASEYWFDAIVADGIPKLPLPPLAPPFFLSPLASRPELPLLPPRNEKKLLKAFVVVFDFAAAAPVKAAFVGSCWWPSAPPPPSLVPSVSPSMATHPSAPLSRCRSARVSRSIARVARASIDDASRSAAACRLASPAAAASAQALESFKYSTNMWYCLTSRRWRWPCSADAVRSTCALKAVSSARRSHLYGGLLRAAETRSAASDAECAAAVRELRRVLSWCWWCCCLPDDDAVALRDADDEDFPRCLERLRWLCCCRCCF